MKEGDYTINTRVEAPAVDKKEASRRLEGASAALEQAMQAVCKEWGVMATYCVTVRLEGPERAQLSSIGGIISSTGLAAAMSAFRERLVTMTCGDEYGSVEQVLRSVNLAREAERDKGR